MVNHMNIEGYYYCLAPSGDNGPRFSGNGCMYTEIKRSIELMLKGESNAHHQNEST